MIDALAAAVASLAARLRGLEALPFNPYSPDADFFDHFAGDGTIEERWTTATSGTATISLPAAAPSYARLASGATAASTATLGWGTRRPLVGMAKGVELRWRARIPTAIDAATVIMPGFRGPTVFTQLTVGVQGSSSTTFFVVQSIDPGVPTITTTVTTVPIDTAWHDWRVQTMPDRVRYYIDNVMVVEHVQGGAVVLPLTQPLAPLFAAANGATAADRQMDVDIAWVRESR